jgi:hypothetical protein
MNEMVLRVLDTSGPARHVAAELGLEPISFQDAGPETPVLVVITDASQVAALSHLRASHAVQALVAWNLTEGEVLRLLEGDLPVYIGQPTPDELRALTWWGESPTPTDADRDLASRLAILEDAFEA